MAGVEKNHENLGEWRTNGLAWSIDHEGALTAPFGWATTGNRSAKNSEMHFPKAATSGQGPAMATNFSRARDPSGSGLSS